MTLSWVRWASSVRPWPRAFDLDRPVFAFDLDFDLMVQKSSPDKTFTPLPRFPEVVRDVAIVVEDEIGAGPVLKAAGSPEAKSGPQMAEKGGAVRPLPGQAAGQG